MFKSLSEAPGSRVVYFQTHRTTLHNPVFKASPGLPRALPARQRMARVSPELAQMNWFGVTSTTFAVHLAAKSVLLTICIAKKCLIDHT